VAASYRVTIPNEPGGSYSNGSCWSEAAYYSALRLLEHQSVKLQQMETLAQAPDGHFGRVHLELLKIFEAANSTMVRLWWP
jgi:hypothetical protein